MITIRKFVDKDAGDTAKVVATTLGISNVKDYSTEFIERAIQNHSAERIIDNSKKGSFFVACDDDKVIGCGGIVGYWGSDTDTFMTTVFVLPEYQGKGIGKRIIQTIEQDDVFLRSRRTEIAALVTAVNFYRKLGYNYKDGITVPDQTGHIRLEKFRDK